MPNSVRVPRDWLFIGIVHLIVLAAVGAIAAHNYHLWTTVGYKEVTQNTIFGGEPKFISMLGPLILWAGIWAATLGHWASSGSR